MADKSIRPIKVLMRGELIDRIDEVLQEGLGGLRTRHRFIEEAVEYYLHELIDASGGDGQGGEAESIVARKARLTAPGHAEGAAQDPPQPLAISLAPSLAALSTDPPWASFVREYNDLADMAISGNQAKSTVRGDEDVSRPNTGALLGLHNRDWPSLQALDLLGKMTVNGPVALSDFYLAATANGWRLAEKLSELQDRSTGRLTALLPSNPAKAKAAEGNYQNFALGWVGRGTQGEPVSTSGPLFAWSCAGLVWNDEELQVGLTPAGVSLLVNMRGLTPIAPHDRETAEVFLGHLRERAPGDWECLSHVLQSLAQGPTRSDLVGKLKAWKNWTDAVAASAAQGYVARGREWGLIESKQTNGRYALTPFGEACCREYCASSPEKGATQ